MTTSIWLQDIGSFSVQLTLLIAVGAILAWVGRIRDPKVTLTYWRSLLLACLVLPACQEWRVIAPPPLEASVVTVVEKTTPPETAAPATAAMPFAGWRNDGLVLILIVAGIAARGLWLALGALSLRRLRRNATPLVPLPRAVADAQARVGARAALYVSERVTGPVSFGLFHPVIIVPPNVLGMDARLQQAITYHELLHVRRRDWVDEIVEEIVRTVFWFHPAVRWLLARVRLSREQVVDRAAIQLTDSRESYVEALLAVALARSPLTLVPAPLFFRRGLLKERVAQILQESTMTTRRLIASLTVSAAALFFVADTAVRSFPLQAGAGIQTTRVQETDAPVHIIRGGENLLHGALPEYPRRAIEQHVEGDVLLDLTIDERGEVSDARVLSGPDELRRAALESVLQWHYSPAALRSTSTQAALRFRVPADSAENRGMKERLDGEVVELKRAAVMFDKLGGARDFVVRHDGEHQAQRAERQLEELTKALEDPNITEQQRAELNAKYREAEERLAKARLMNEMAVKDHIRVVEREESVFSGPHNLAQVRSERVPQALIESVLARAGAKVGDVITEESEKRIVEAARSIDEHMKVSFVGDDDNATVTIVLVLP